VAADGHKWLNVPYDSGFAFVRDGEMLRAAFSSSGAYLALPPSAGVDPFAYVPEMSRRFRALAAWCALRAYGRDGYRQLVERCVANAQQFAAWVDATPALELLAPVDLIIVCFRYAPDSLGDAVADAFNRKAVTEIQADGRAFVTGTVWNGKAAIRAAFDNWTTMPEDVDILAQAVAQVGARLSRD
jgi:glutamate/tyrosine decarboxylase-like PLP-dependent enzyme